jgi:hypothetical protein
LSATQCSWRASELLSSGDGWGRVSTEFLQVKTHRTDWAAGGEARQSHADAAAGRPCPARMTARAVPASSARQSGGRGSRGCRSSVQLDDAPARGDRPGSVRIVARRSRCGRRLNTAPPAPTESDPPGAGAVVSRRRGTPLLSRIRVVKDGRADERVRGDASAPPAVAGRSLRRQSGRGSTYMQPGESNRWRDARFPR